MAYPGSKGWYVQKLKEGGVNKHPTDRRKLENHKESTLRNLYNEFIENKKN